MEQTLVLIKPDAVERGLVGKIINRFEEKGLKIVAMKMEHISREVAEAHYREHRGKPFYRELVDFITSGPLVAMVLQGPGAIETVRRIMGDTAGTTPGTIRGDWAEGVTRNLVHGSDSPASAAREIAIFFGQGEGITR
ncbi:MAG TPA: nucleoside-diphosphate kinase [Firmicutes bacterium]|nr:nucleoside-diphosphate kinase [Bacillota bacterium]